MGKVSHLAFIVGGSKAYMREESTTLDDAYERKFENVERMIAACVKRNIPIVTFLLLPQEIEKHDQYPLVVDSLVSFINKLSKAAVVHENQVKISVIGHWYSLPGRLVDPIKQLIEDTKDYDSFFINLCLNYDGQQEIVDAAKLIAHQVKAGKLDPEVVAKEHIKENVYTSHRLPPDVIVKTGMSRKLSGFLLWDSTNADIHITGRPWQYFTEQDLDKALG